MEALRQFADDWTQDWQKMRRTDPDIRSPRTWNTHKLNGHGTVRSHKEQAPLTITDLDALVV
jgi:hypothetical protein